MQIVRARVYGAAVFFNFLTFFFVVVFVRPQEWESQVKILEWLNTERKPIRFGSWTAHEVEVRFTHRDEHLCFCFCFFRSVPRRRRSKKTIFTLFWSADAQRASFFFATEGDPALTVFLLFTRVKFHGCTRCIVFVENTLLALQYLSRR